MDGEGLHRYCGQRARARVHHVRKRPEGIMFIGKEGNGEGNIGARMKERDMYMRMYTIIFLPFL